MPKAGARKSNPNVCAAAEHAILLNHKLDWDNPRIIMHEAHTHRRRIKEAFTIHMHQTMNRDSGLELSKLWADFIIFLFYIYLFEGLPHS